MYKLAVLIPVYNNMDGFHKSLNSIGNSIIDGFQLDVIVVDDGSFPELAISANYTSKLGIILIKQPANSGIVAAMNTGLEYILKNDYKYIARLDAGDTVVPERFIKQIDLLNKNKDICLVGSYACFVDMQGEPVYTYVPPVSDAEIRKAMYYNNAFCHPAVMFRSEGVKQLGLYSSDFPHAEDYEYFCRFVNNYKTFNIPRALVNVEINPSGISIKNRGKQVATRLKVQLNMFDYKSINSVLGLVKTLALLITPYSLVLKIKNMLGKAR